MSESATTRIPYEIWESILLEVIAIVSPPHFDVSCTSSNYLAFKRSCGDGESPAYRYEYDASERHRRTMRLVCRSWSDFAERWDVRERWIRITSLSNEKEISYERWKGAWRVDFCGFSSSNRLDWPQNMEAAKLCATLSNWRTMSGHSELYGHGGMSLRRLEVIGSMDRYFDDVVNALCDASTSLTCLRSLTICIASSSGQPLRKLSKHFPGLLHLTLRVRSEGSGRYHAEQKEELQTNDPSADSLVLKNLEVLFVIPAPDYRSISHLDVFILSNWSLPALRHVQIGGVGTPGVWRAKVFPFLKRHASTIETIDLDNIDHDLGGPHAFIFDPTIVDFWGTFPRLKLLRCDLSRGRFKAPPPECHPFEWLVNLNSIDSKKEFITTVAQWAEDGIQVKRLKHLVLFGSYFSSGTYRRDGGLVQEILRNLQLNGTMLTNPAGKSWLGMS